MQTICRWSVMILALALLFGCSSMFPQQVLEAAPLAAEQIVPAGDRPSIALGNAAVLHPVLPSSMPIMLQPLANNAVSPKRPIEPDDDAWSRMRRGFAIPDLDSPLVDSFARRFAANGSLHGVTGERLRLYLHFLLGEIEARGMPTELALLPIVESSLNPHARSPVGAAGAWQFMPATGKRFEMRQSRLVDDRKSILASTRGALAYLQELQSRFGDWHLALAAYNWGEGAVTRAQARNRAAGRATDYLSLNMPKETRNYVPQLAALIRLVRDPVAYGAQLPQILNQSYFRQVDLRRDVDFNLALRLAEVSEKEFVALNASVTRPLIIASATPSLLLPLEAADRFSQRLDAYAGPTASWTAIRIQKGQHIEWIARDHRTSATSLRRVNGIPLGKKPVAGSTLLVPSTTTQAPIASSMVEAAYLQFSPDLIKSAVKARRGETLSVLARRLHLAPFEIARWNGLKTKTRLKAGQVITIYRVRNTDAAEVNIAADKLISTARPRSKKINRAKTRV